MLSETMPTQDIRIDRRREDRRQIGLDVLFGLVAFLWCGAAMIVALTWDWHTAVLANAALLCAGVVSVVTVQLAVSWASQRRWRRRHDRAERQAEQRHRELARGLAALAAQVEQLGTTTGAKRWMDWAQEVASQEYGQENLVPFPARHER
ncbi:hypothetical protein [Phytohabitans aurantiacus]|uniref:Uncharacterized protein n=1 Tax=Phytohabitans aurantiacus TaxID=3016789 RepID=A0ABQ5QK44_9ACTN|nr:hypothetical protein [Phytohabitans aurantiacus]GLH94930.1 hypothetical protein Pa4123_02020 [Phytohabitans aurantiacus]